MAKAAQEALEDRNLPIQVAVMGCVVNGPGEAREADLGIAAGRKRGHLFIKGKIVRVVPEDEMVEALVDEAEKLVAEGVEARLAAADAGAEAEAEADRQALLDEAARTPTTPQSTIDADPPARRRSGVGRARRPLRSPGTTGRGLDAATGPSGRPRVAPHRREPSRSRRRPAAIALELRRPSSHARTRSLAPSSGQTARSSPASSPPWSSSIAAERYRR